MGTRRARLRTMNRSPEHRDDDGEKQPDDSDKTPETPLDEPPPTPVKDPPSTPGPDAPYVVSHEAYGSGLAAAIPAAGESGRNNHPMEV